MTHIIDKQQGEKIVVIKGSCRCTEAVIDAFATPATIIHRNPKEAKKKNKNRQWQRTLCPIMSIGKCPPKIPGIPLNTPEHLPVCVGISSEICSASWSIKADFIVDLGEVKLEVSKLLFFA